MGKKFSRYQKGNEVMSIRQFCIYSLLWLLVGIPVLSFILIYIIALISEDFANDNIWVSICAASVIIVAILVMQSRKFIKLRKSGQNLISNLEDVNIGE